MDKGNEKLIDW